MGSRTARVISVGLVAASLALGSCGASTPAENATEAAPTSAPERSTTSGAPVAATATEEESGSSTGGSGDANCAVLSASAVSEIVGVPFVPSDPGIDGGGGDFEESGYEGTACTFDAADGGARSLVVVAYRDAAELFDVLVATSAEDAGTEGQPLNGVGQKAVYFQDKISATAYALGTDGTLAVLILDVFDGSSAGPVMTQLAEATVG